MNRKETMEECEQRCTKKGKYNWGLFIIEFVVAGGILACLAHFF